MAVLLPNPFYTALDASGNVVSGATLTFYKTGTSTLTAIYANSTLATTLTNPVTANSAGRFPAIYLDDTQIYRAVLKDASGIPVPGGDIDPINGSGSVNTSNGTSMKSAGATGGGTANDTANLNAVFSTAASGATFMWPAGSYLVDPLTFSGTKFYTIQGVGTPVLKANNTGSILNVPSDPAFNAGIRVLAGVNFDGNPIPGSGGTGIGAYGSLYRIGAYGLKYGSPRYSAATDVINATTRDAKFSGLEVGLFHYSDQEAFDLNIEFYTNYVGCLIQGDPETGGATASVSYHCTYQYNVIGVMMDNIGRFALGTTATLTNSSTTISSVGSLTGVIVGHKVKGPGILPGTTVAALPGGGAVTLSQATTSTAAMTSCPVLFYTDFGTGFGFGTGWTFDGVCTFQGNSGPDLVMVGFDGVTVTQGTHFERTAAGTGLTYNGRVIPACGTYVDNSEALFDGCLFAQSFVGTSMQLANGARVRMKDCHAPGATIAVAGDNTCRLDFFGRISELTGAYQVPVGRFPDTITIANAVAMCGPPTQTRSNALLNGSTNISPRVPVFTANGGTLATVIDAIGPCTSAAFTGIGSISNSVYMPLLNGVTAAGDTIGQWIRVKANKYTRLTVQWTNGTGGFTIPGIPVSPGWNRLFFAAPIVTAQTGVNAYFWPTDADGPTFYFESDMQYRVPTGGDLNQLSQILGMGLFAGEDALIGTATIDLVSIAAGAPGAEQTITVPGAVVGNRVAVTAALDSQGLAFDARVSAANTVKFLPRNPTVVAIDLASTTFTARVLP